MGQRKARIQTPAKLTALQRIWHCFIHLSKEAVDVEPTAVRVSLVAYLLVLCVSAVDLRTAAPDLHATLELTVEAIYYLSAVYTCVSVCVFLRLTHLRQPLNSRRLLLASVYLILFNTYIVFPLMVWSHTLSYLGYFFGSDARIGLAGVVFGMLVTGLAFAFAALVFLFGRNTFPCNKSLLSTTDSRKEMLQYFLNIAVVISAVYEHCAGLQAGLSTSRVTIYCFRSLLQAAVLVCAGFNDLYWHRSTTNLLNCGYLAVFLAKQAVDLSKMFDLGDRHAVVVLLIFPFASTLMIKRSDSLRKVNFLSKSISSGQRKLGVLYFEDLWVKSKNQTLTPQEYNTFCYYRGLVDTYINQTDSISAAEAEHLYDDPHNFLKSFIASLQTHDLDSLETQLMLMLCNVMPNLTMVFSSLKKLELQCAKSYVDTSKYSQIKYLFESKLMSMYKGRIKDDDRKALSIRDCFNEIKLLELMVNEDNYIDTALPIRAKSQYLLLNENIRSMLSYYEDVFGIVGGNHKLSYKKLFDCNKCIFEADLLIRRQIEDFLDALEDSCIANMLIGCLIYLRTIRFDQTKSKVLFQMYKTKRQKLLQASVSGPVTQLNFLKDSCSIEVTLQKGAAGEILDHSQSLQNIMGKPKNGTVHGFNLNELFPKNLRAAHRKLMEEFYTIPILNAQRVFFLNGFDGFVREVKFVVKIMPYLHRHVTSVVFLRPLQHSDKTLLLLDEQHEIIASQEKFNRILLACPVQPPLTNLNSLICRLGRTVNLFRAFLNYLEVQPSKTDTKGRALRKDLLARYSSIDFYNRTRGLEFEIDPASPFEQHLPGVSAILSIEFSKFMDRHLCKILIKFEMKTKPPVLRGYSSVYGIDEHKESDNDSNNKQPTQNELSPMLESFIDFHRIDSAEVDIILGTKTMSYFIEALYDTVLKHGLLDVSSNGLHIGNIKEKTLMDLINQIVGYKVEHDLYSPEYKRNSRKVPGNFAAMSGGLLQSRRQPKRESNSPNSKSPSDNSAVLTSKKKSQILSPNSKMPSAKSIENPSKQAVLLGGIVSNMGDHLQYPLPSKLVASKQLMRLINDDYDLNTPRAGKRASSRVVDNESILSSRMPAARNDSKKPTNKKPSPVSQSAIPHTDPTAFNLKKHTREKSAHHLHEAESIHKQKTEAMSKGSSNLIQKLLANMMVLSSDQMKFQHEGLIKTQQENPSTLGQTHEVEELEKVVNHAIFERKANREAIHTALSILGLLFCVASFFGFLQMNVQQMVSRQIGYFSVIESLTHTTIHTKTSSIIAIEALMLYRGRTAAPGSQQSADFDRDIKDTILAKVPDGVKLEQQFHFEDFFKDYSNLYKEFIKNKDFAALGISESLLHKKVQMQDGWSLAHSSTEQQVVSTNRLVSFLNANSITSYAISRILYFLDQWIKIRQTQPAIEASIQLLMQRLELRIIFYLVNNFEKILPQLEKAYEEVRLDVTVHSRERYTRSFYLFVGIYFFVAFLTVAWTVFSRVYADRQLIAMVETYIFVTPAELDYILTTIHNKSQFYEGLNRDEEDPEEGDIASKYNPKLMKKSVLGPIGRVHKASTKNERFKKLKKDQTNTSLKATVAVAVIFTLKFFGLATICFLLSLRVEKIFNLKSLFFLQAQKIFGISSHFSRYYLLTVFGDYIQMDGQYVSQMASSSTAIDDFSDYWISNKQLHRDLLGPSYDLLLEFLNSDSCKLKESTEDNSGFFTELCSGQGSEFFGRGLFYFLIYSDQYISGLIEAKKPDLEVHLQRSKQQLSYFDEKLWFQPEYSRIRAGILQTMTYLIEFVSSATTARLSAFLEDTNILIVDFELWTSLVFVGASLLLGAAWHAADSRDKNYCHETFHVINPEIIGKNPYISNKFMQHYQYR